MNLTDGDLQIAPEGEKKFPSCYQNTSIRKQTWKNLDSSFECLAAERRSRSLLDVILILILSVKNLPKRAQPHVSPGCQLKLPLAK